MSFSPGLLSGAVAMSSRRGFRWHRVAGNVFFVSMLTMATAGAYMAILKHQPVMFRAAR